MHRFGYPKREPKPTIRVLMLKDAVGAPDGITRTEYQSGVEYDLPEDLAASFFSNASADPAEAHAQPVGAPNLTAEESADPAAPALTPETENARPEPRRARRRAS